MRKEEPELTKLLFKKAERMSSLVDEISEPIVELRCAIKNGYENLIRKLPATFDGDQINDIKEYEKIIKANLNEYGINLEIKPLYDEVMSYYTCN